MTTATLSVARQVKILVTQQSLRNLQGLTVVVFVVFKTLMIRYFKNCVCVLAYCLLTCGCLLSSEMTYLSVEELEKLFDAALRKPELPLSINYIVETVNPPPTQKEREESLKFEIDDIARSTADLEPDVRKRLLDSVRNDIQKRSMEDEAVPRKRLWKATEVVSKDFYKREQIDYKTSGGYDLEMIEHLPIVANEIDGIAVDPITHERFVYSVSHHLRSASVDRHRTEVRMDMVWRAYGMELNEFGGPIILALGKRNSKEKWNRTRDAIENAEFDSNKAEMYAKGETRFESIQGESIVWNGIQCRQVIIESRIPDSARRVNGVLLPQEVFDLPIKFKYIFNATNFSLFYYGEYENPHEPRRYVSIREGFDSNGVPRIWRRSGFRGKDDREGASTTHIVNYQLGLKSDLSTIFRFEPPVGYMMSEISNGGIGRSIDSDLLSLRQKRVLIMVVFLLVTVLTLVLMLKFRGVR
jgi:hypothetical protein